MFSGHGREERREGGREIERKREREENEREREKEEAGWQGTAFI